MGHIPNAKTPRHTKGENQGQHQVKKYFVNNRFRFRQVVPRNSCLWAQSLGELPDIG